MTQIVLNGADRKISVKTLTHVLDELGYGNATIATAVNGVFIPQEKRVATNLNEGDRLEVLAPREGG